MTEDMKALWGRILVGLGLLLIAGAAVTWSAADRSNDAKNDVADLLADYRNDPFYEPSEADHTLSLVLGAGGSLSLVLGVIFLATARPEPPDVDDDDPVPT